MYLFAHVNSALLRLVLSSLIALVAFPALLLAQDLPSWNDTAAKSRIVEFVRRTTTEGEDGYVPEDDRIAVFDNDGTLWSEQPFYFQLAFVFDRIKALAPLYPQWQVQEPFKSVLANDFPSVAKGGEHALLELVTATHAGLTTDEFDKIVTDWFATAKHPETGRLYTEMTFLPMRELLAYLREHGFRTYIVSGGGVEFMRSFAHKAYGIPPEQVIGSTIATEYSVEGDTPVLRRLPKIDFIDDGPGKPVGINKFIGRRPIFAAGNSDGDYEMLRWVTAGKRDSFAMIVHHTDSEREFAYDRKSPVGRLDKALDEAKSRDWLVVDMKTDWNKVYDYDR